MRKSVRRKVIRVIDGDTVRLARRVGNTNIVRLSGYDAPERNRRGGRKATNMLRGMIGGKQVTIKPEARDSYGRLVGTLYCNRHNVNKRMKERL